jgi:hypothetical protein
MAYHKLEPNRQSPLAPDQRILEAKRTPQWYADNVRYISRFYNIPLNNSFIQEYQGQDSSKKVDVFEDNPVQYMLRMMLYYLGRQPNLDYNHLSGTTSTGNIMPNWIKGQNVHNLISFLRDRINDLLRAAKFSVTSMSEVSISERKQLMEILMVQMEMQGQFAQIEQEFGIRMDLANGKKFEFKEDIDYWMQNGYIDLDAEIEAALAENFWVSNHGHSKFMQAFLHTAVTGLCGTHHYVSNGMHCMDIVMPHQIIPDRRIDDDYNRKARFVGIIKPYTVDEILTLWPNTNPTQVEELRAMSKNSNAGAPFNTDNVTWWTYGHSSGNTITTLTGYWITYHDLGKKTFTNSYGIEKLRDAKDGEVGDDFVEDVAKATVIGNAFVTDFGYINNVAEDFYNKNKPLLPVRVFMPNMLLGESRSIVSRIHQLQDERDMYKFKIKETVARSKGRVAVIRGDKLGNGVNVKELESDLATLGITVVTTDGEAAQLGGGGEDRGHVVESLDMTMDPNVEALLLIIQQIDKEMQEIANVSDIAMSQQQVYVGLGTQQNAMQNSSGSSSLYSLFMDFVQQNVQYGVDVDRHLITLDNADRYESLIGRRGVEYVKLSERIKYNNPLVRVIIDPVIPKEAKERMISIAQAVAQNQGMDMLDFVKVEKSNSYIEVEKFLAYSIDKKKRELEAQQAMQQMVQQVNQQNTELAQQGNVLTQAMAKSPQPQQQ